MRHIKHKPRSVSRNTSLPTIALLSAAAIAGLALPPVEAAEMSAFEIAARSDRSDRGFESSRVKMKMVLRNAAGKEATR